MVTDPAEYRWSSFLYHGSGKDDPLLGPFPESEELGKTDAERRRRSQAKVLAVQSEAELMNVHRSLWSDRENRLPDLAPVEPIDFQTHEAVRRQVVGEGIPMDMFVGILTVARSKAVCARRRSFISTVGQAIATSPGNPVANGANPAVSLS